MHSGKMTHAIAVTTTKHSEFFRRLFVRYATECTVVVDGRRYGAAELEQLQQSWCTNAKIRASREFRLTVGGRFVASFGDSVAELMIAVEEREWIHALSEERLLRYKVLPVR